MSHKELMDALMQLTDKERESLLRESRRYKRKNLWKECHRRLYSYAEVIADEDNVDVEEILSKSRIRQLVNARYCIFHQLIKDGFSYSIIGEVSGCHHSTIIFGCKAVNDAIDYPRSNTSLLDAYNKFNNHLNENTNETL